MDIPYVNTFAKQLRAERLLVHTQCGLYDLFDIRCVQYDEERDSTWIVTFIMVSISDRNRWLALRVHFTLPLETAFPKYPGATWLHIPNQELIAHVDCKMCAFREDTDIADTLRAFGVLSKRSLAVSPWISTASVNRLVSILRCALQKVGLGAATRLSSVACAGLANIHAHVVQTCWLFAVCTSPADHRPQPLGDSSNEVADKL